MHQGYTGSDLTTMENNVMKDIYPLTARLMPQGRVDIHWAYPLMRNDMIDIGNSIKLYEVSHDLDRVRKEWNKLNVYDQVVVAFGIVDGTVATGDKTGLGLLAGHQRDPQQDGAGAVEDPVRVYQHGGQNLNLWPGRRFLQH